MATLLARQLSGKELEEAAEANLDNQEWRLNNLYYIKDKAGKKILFKMNWAQRLLFRGMWYLNIILKARQLGMSTFIQIYMLDTCLFNSNMNTLVIAHGKQEAKAMFQDKIKFAYDNLDPQIKLRETITADTKNVNELKFSNGSRIAVATSGRSGTYQMVHISEFGKIAIKYPDRAREIVTGTLEAVHPGQMIFIESTAEGREGRFYDMCKTAKAAADSRVALSQLDYKFWFLPWWKHPENVIDPTNVVLFPHIKEYIDELEAKLKIKLTMGQKAWYALKEKSLGSDIKREHPSTPEEAWEQTVEGAYYGAQMTTARQKGRIGKVPHTVGIPVDTWWDIGLSDTTAIWFTQTIGAAIHVIDYFEANNEGVGYYKDVLDKWHDEKGYRYGVHVWPHDGGRREWGNDAKTVQASANAKGLYPEIKPPGTIQDGVEAVREILSICWFDEENCSKLVKTKEGEQLVGINSLESYRKEWDERLGRWKTTHLHNWASNGADAFRYMAVHYQAIRTVRVPGSKRGVKKSKSGGWT